METILRVAAVYGVLVVIFRIAGKRTLTEATTFDFVLLLVISEATQQALVRDDYSVTKALVVILTFVAIDVSLSLVKQRWQTAERILDGLPLLIVADGHPLRERMDNERVDEEDVLEAARRLHGLERLEDVKYAVLERSGGISIVPRGR
jgi:uncharacterized membrane protein YcaP (DUF421 family)